MEKILIKKETITNARDYIPLAEKETFVSSVASVCVDALTFTEKNTEANGAAFPPYYHANISRVNRAMMTALASLYLQQAVEMDYIDDGVGIVTVEEYDRLAGSHIISQLQRMKSDMVVRDKIFDILSDYSELERMLKSKLEELTAPRNDTTVRMTLNTKMAVDEIPKLEKMLREYNEQKEKGNEEGG